MSSSGRPSFSPSRADISARRSQCPDVYGSRASMLWARLKSTPSAFRVRRCTASAAASERVRANSSLKSIGLLRKSSAPALMPFDAIFRRRKPGDQDNGREPRFRRRLDTAADLETVHAGHHDIEKDQVRAERSALGKRSSAVALRRARRIPRGAAGSRALSARRIRRRRSEFFQTFIQPSLPSNRADDAVQEDTSALDSGPHAILIRFELSLAG